MAEIPTKPYLLRAIHEWCTDNGYTPYIAVKVGTFARVPMQYVRDGQIVLDISYDATSGLLIGNDYVEFKARFGGQSREIMVPVANVMAIYARETGQGMAFPPEEDEVSEDGDVPLMDDSEPDMESDEESSAERVVQLVPVKAEAEASGEEDAPRTPPPAGGRPALKRVK